MAWVANVNVNVVIGKIKAVNQFSFITSE